MSQFGIKDVYKQFTHDQDKMVPPAETVSHFKQRLQESQLNILTETQRIDSGRLNIPVFFSVCGHEAQRVIGTRKQMGKGASIEQAEASAVMELAERYSFFSFLQDSKNMTVGPYSKMKQKAISFQDIARSVHDQSDDLPLLESIFSDIPLFWTQAYNLSKETQILIPINWFYMINEFNGPSAGNCIEEALIQGICEVIERHVSSIISHERLSAPLIDVSQANNDHVLDMLHNYKTAGIQLYISDFTMNTGIPTISIVAMDPSTFPQKSEIVWTAGSATSPEKALSRALTEVAQLAGDFNSGSNYEASGLPKIKSLQDIHYLIHSPQKIFLSDLVNISDNNFKTEIMRCIEALTQIDLDIFYVNTTHPELQIPACYTIIPGAHFRERAKAGGVGMFLAKIIVDSFKAKEAIQKLIEMDTKLPGKYYIQFYLGQTYLEMEQVDRAIACFQKALALDPTPEDRVAIEVFMASGYSEKGMYKDALQVLSSSEKIDQERTDIYNLKGFCHFKLKEHEKAIQCFEKVIQLNPGSAIDYANIGSNYRDMGNIPLAIQYYEKALLLDPTITFAKDNLMTLLSKK